MQPNNSGVIMEELHLSRAWALTENVTPLVQDCGALCGAQCCAADEDGQGGVFLFPGEEQLIGDADWARIERTDALGGCLMLTCAGRCDRAKRPLGCRIFPLTPVPLKGGGWGVRIDRRSFAMCPLAQSGKRGLSPAFVEAVSQVVNELAQDPAGARFLRDWARLERRYGEARLF